MERTLYIRDSFVHGLRPYEDLPLGTSMFESLHGLRVTPRGLVSSVPIIQYPTDGTLLSNDIIKSFPFPQLFRGRMVTLLAAETSLFYVNESDGTLTPIVTYDLYNPAFLASITNNNRAAWHFADFGAAWALFNGECCVIKSGFVDPNKVFVQSDITIYTGCTHRKRAILAGFNSDDFWNRWVSTWSAYTAVAESWGFALSAPGQNSIWFGSIGGGGDMLHLFLPDLAIHGIENESLRAETGAYNVNDPLFLELARGLSSGVLTMDWQGAVLCVKPLGKTVIAYGSDGISAISAVSEPIPTYGRIEDLARDGIVGRFAVGGDESIHCFLDETGYLWTVDESLKPVRRGYVEFFEEFNHASKPVVSYNKQEREFYICAKPAGSDGYAYTLTESGLSRTHNLVFSFSSRRPVDTSMDLAIVEDISTVVELGTLGSELVRGGDMTEFPKEPNENWIGQHWQCIPLTGPPYVRAQYYSPAVPPVIGELYQHAHQVGLLSGQNLYLVSYKMPVVSGDGAFAGILYNPRSTFQRDYPDFPPLGRIRKQPGEYAEIMACMYDWIDPVFDITVFFSPVSGYPASKVEVDDVSVKAIINPQLEYGPELAIQENWELDENWSFDINGALVYEYIGGGDYPLAAMLVDILVYGKLYAFTFTISGVAPGRMRIASGGSGLSWFNVTEDGTYTYYFYGMVGYPNPEEPIYFFLDCINTGPVSITDMSLRQITTDVDAFYSHENMYFEFITHPHDLGSSGIKHINWLELKNDGLTNLYAKAYFRMDSSSDWMTTDWIPGSPSGEFHIGVAGTQFKFAIKGDRSGSLSRPDHLTVRFEYADPRASRDWQRSDIQSPAVR